MSIPLCFVLFALSEIVPRSFPNLCMGASPCLGAGPHGLARATFSVNEKLKSGSLIHRGARYDREKLETGHWDDDKLCYALGYVWACLCM